MKVTVMTRLFAERDMDIDTAHYFLNENRHSFFIYIFCKINSNTNYNSTLAET